MSGSDPNERGVAHAQHVHPRPVLQGVAKGRRRAQAVLLRVVVAGRLDVPGQRGPEAREARPDRLEGDRLGSPDRDARRRSSGRRRRSSTTRASSATVTEPCSRSIRPRLTVVMWPARTTFSMLRSRSSSHVPSVGALAIVGVTDRSMRCMMPASSSRRNSSSNDAASTAAPHHVGDHAQVDRPGRAGSPPGSASTGRGGAPSRSRRGRPRARAATRTRRSRSCRTRRSTYWLGDSSVRGRSLTGITRAPSPTPNLGGVSAGMSGRGSGHRRRGSARAPRTAHRRSAEANVRSPT